MADAKGKQLEVFVSKTEAELLSGEPNVLGLSSDRNTIVFNGKVVGSGANIHYKKIAISSSGTGWYRFAVNRGGFASQPSAIFCIERSYGQRKDEHYLFASTRNHVGNGNITQLAGYHNGGNGHFITKIRFAQKTSSANTDSCFLDFYTTAETGETYYVWIIGNWNALDIYKVDDEEEGQTYAYQVIETSLGFMPSEYTEFRNKLLCDAPISTEAPTDENYVITQGRGDYANQWFRRPFSLVWSYIKSKIASVLGLTETSLKIGSHTEFKSDGDVEMQYGSTYGNYNKALGYQSYGGLASGVEGKPYAQFKALPTLAMTVDGGTTYFAEALPSASLTYTYDGTEHSYTNSSAYTQWVVIINHADFLGSGVFPFNKCYFFGGRVLPDAVIASATELTEGSGTWQVVLQSTMTTTNTSIDRTTSATLRALIASTNVTAYGTAAGRQSFVGGYYSNAFGYRAGTGVANYANAFGNQSYCGGQGALAFGMFSLALGQNAIALGERSVASGSNAVTLGYEAMAATAYSNALGAFTKTGRQYQTALGCYNEGKSDTLLEVGNGSSSARKNVFEVTTSGVAKATRFEGRLGKKICVFDKSYVNAVVLLCKVDAWSGYMTLVGKIFVEQSGVNRFASYDVAMHYSTGASSVYNSRFYLSGNSYDAALNLHLVQCTYNGEKWWALQKKGVQQTTMYFTGYDYNVSWEMIGYYNTNTSTVLNEEINSSIVNCDEVLQLPTKTDGTKAVYEDKVLAQYLAKAVVVNSSSSTYTNQYVKFATIDVSNNAWENCSGTIIMSGEENPIYGIASFLFRSGSANTVVNQRKVEWEVLHNADYADSIKVVMTSNNVYDLYFQPKDNYIATRFEFISQEYAKITLHSNQSYVESIDAVVSSSLTGKVQSATQLATARTIGVSGGVVGTAQSFDGTRNVSIPITSVYDTAERTATTARVNPLWSSIGGGATPPLASRLPFVRENLLSFNTSILEAVEYTKDGGETWVDYGLSNEVKTSLLTDGFTAKVIAGNGDTTIAHKLKGLRFVLTANNLYCVLSHIVMWGSMFTGTKVKVEYLLNGATEWVELTNGSASYDPGYTIIYTGRRAFRNYSTATAATKSFRVTLSFNRGTDYDDSTSGNPIRLFRIAAYSDILYSTNGSEMSKTGHLYSYDTSKNAIFPANVTAEKFIGNLEGTATKATADASGNVIAETYVKSIEAKGGTLEVTKGDDTTEEVAIPNHEVLQFDGIITDEITVNAQSVTAWSKIYWASSVGKFVAAVTTLSTDSTTTKYYNNFDNGTIRLADYTANKIFRNSTSAQLYVLLNGTLTPIAAGTAETATQDAEGNTITDTYYSNVVAVGNQLTFTKPSGATKTVAIDVEGGETTSTSATIATPEFDGIITDEITEAISGVLTWDKIYYSTTLKKFVARSGTLANYTYHGTFQNNDNSYLQYGNGQSGGTLTNKTFRKSGTNELYVYNATSGTLDKISAVSLNSTTRTEFITWNAALFRCSTNEKITKYPSSVGGAVLYLQSGNDIISTAITFNGISLTRYPIKLCVDIASATWVDGFITINRTTSDTYGYIPNITIYDANMADITRSILTSRIYLQGYLTAAFTES